MTLWEVISNILLNHGDTLGIGALLVTLLSIVARGLFTGSLLFRKQYEELRTDKDNEINRLQEIVDKRVADAQQSVNNAQRIADKFEVAYTNEAKARGLQAKALDELGEYARAADKMLKALPTSQPSSSSPRKEDE